MRGVVYYMVNSDRPDTPGLIFPTETLHADFRVGHWYVEIDSDGLLSLYNFDVVINGEITTYPLKRIRNNIFQVSLTDGASYYFQIDVRRYWNDRYVGVSRIVSRNNRLFQVYPIDPAALTVAAKDKKTFFVGSVDNELSYKQ